ncbi:3-ketoacyl-ACP reductase (plasmid) [Antarctobacter heliothermus]|uniref:3-ketoacyl-ACP reductase n=1 Tax=Antarctobacter heliothermus TaxID=74033 RepID=A0A222EBH6_9RHOB|nr:SDR family oxidoreductase [Antarctobacter heliothermus]ASP23549.1 3-ketoacyl-ACP reductase [Antarctobacter heliothermus]
MAKRLEQCVALVTGAGAVGPGWGNGRTTAVLFAREGAKVIVADRDLAATEETVEIIRGEGGNCVVCEADVTDADSVSALVDRAVSEYGGIDILHNNVGASLPGGPEDMSLEDFRRQLHLNLTSVFLTCKLVLPVMREHGGGVINNVGSIGGLKHLGHNHVGYSASKAGLVQFSRQIAVQYGPEGIRCNTIIPGMIDAPLLEHRVSQLAGRADLETLREQARQRVPLGRRGDAWDVAHAALFLASDEARYITGTELLVDGGLMARSA